jgi:ABC-type sugar transport system permease subunit
VGSWSCSGTSTPSSNAYQAAGGTAQALRVRRTIASGRQALPAVPVTPDGLVQLPDQRGDPAQEFTLDNYVYLFTDPALHSALINNLLWIIVVPAGAVAICL